MAGSFLKTKDIVLVALFCALTIVLGLIPPIPMPGVPVPITLQTFGVMLAGLILGPARAGFVLLLYVGMAVLGIPVLLFNVLSMAIGYFIPRFVNIEKKQSIAIGMEIGIHNGTLAIYIALSVLGNSMMSVPPAIYSLLMFFTAAIFGFWVSRGKANS